MADQSGVRALHFPGCAPLAEAPCAIARDQTGDGGVERRIDPGADRYGLGEQLPPDAEAFSIVVIIKAARCAIGIRMHAHRPDLERNRAGICGQPERDLVGGHDDWRACIQRQSRHRRVSRRIAGTGDETSRRRRAEADQGRAVHMRD